MCVYAYVFMSLCVFTSVSVYICTCLYVCSCICACVCLCVCACLCIYVSLCICIYVFVCLCGFMCVSLCVCMCLPVLCVCVLHVWLCAHLCVCVCLGDTSCVAGYSDFFSSPEGNAHLDPLCPSHRKLCLAQCWPLWLQSSCLSRRACLSVVSSCTVSGQERSLCPAVNSLYSSPVSCRHSACWGGTEQR